MNNGLYPNGLNHHRSLKFQKLRKLISQNQAKVKIEGLYGSSLSFLLIDVFSSLNTQIFYPDDRKGSQMEIINTTYLRDLRLRDECKYTY